MNKTNSVPLIDLLRANEGKHRGGGKRLFLNRKKEITFALDEGFSIKEVYDSLGESDNTQIAYRTFCDYVRRYIREAE